jgi:hypothetical protein
MNYQINISIDNQGLQAIYDSGLYVTLVKSVAQQPASQGCLPIAWVAFQPQQTNRVSWQEQYWMYATTAPLQAGATLIVSSETSQPIQTGWTYTFKQGQFQGQSGGGETTFNLNNQQQGSYSFGLVQQAAVNNTQVSAPLNAIPLAYNMSATFAPLETISLFLSSYSNNGSVVSQVASNALVMTLSSQNPVANVGFNDATNTFYLE